MIHFPEDYARQLHLNEISVLQNETGDHKGLRDDYSVEVGVLDFDRDSCDQTNCDAKKDLRLFDQNTDLLAFLCTILIEHCMQVVELRGGTPPVFAVSLNSIKQDSFLIQNHHLVRLWLGEQGEKGSDLITFTKNCLKADTSWSLTRICWLHRLINCLTSHTS